MPPRKTGQPLRFIAMVLLLWTGARVAMTMPPMRSGLNADASPLPLASLASAPRGRTPVAARGLYYGKIGRIGRIGPQNLSSRPDRIPIVRAEPRYANAPWVPPMALPPMTPVLHPAGASPVGMSMAVEDQSSRISIPPAASIPAPGTGGQRHWSGSAWLFWRDDGASRALGSAGQLGGAQAGFRISRRIADGGENRVPVSVYGRLTTALRKPAMAESAFGMAISPLSGQTPVSFALERRIALGRTGRDAFALVAAGGLNPVEIGHGWIAEGYAQAGMVGLSRKDPFIDGRFSLTLPLDPGKETRVGASISGGAQPGVSRLDAGPAIETRLPLGRIRPRLMMEWRQRIAGDARPGSGVTVTLASDF